MNGLPIDINTSAASTDNGSARANRPRRDGDLRGPQFEQLLLALTAAKPLPCGTNDLSASTARKPLASYDDAPAASNTRYASGSNSSSSTTAVKEVGGQSDTIDSDIEDEAATEESGETSEEPQSHVDPAPQLVACTFDNRLVPLKPDAPPEEPTGDGTVVEGERKPGVAIADNASTQPAAELSAGPGSENPAETAVEGIHSEVTKAASDDLTGVASDRVRRGSRGRSGKDATDEPEIAAESQAPHAAVSNDATRKTASRGDEHLTPLANETPREAQGTPELASGSDTQAVNPVTEDSKQPQSSPEPATKEGLRESRLASAEDAPKSSASSTAPVMTPPTTPAPTNVVPPPVVPAAQQQSAQTATSSNATSSKTDATGGVSATPANRLPHKAVAAARSNGPAGSSQIDTVKFIQRIARAMQTAREAGGEIRLRLSPPELGSMKMEVKVQDGTLIAKVETETAQAQSTLIDNLPALKERLAEQGVRIERFDVDVSRDDRGQSGFADRQGSSDRGSQPRAERRDAFHRQVGDPVEAGSVSNPITTPQSINVVA